MTDASRASRARPHAERQKARDEVLEHLRRIEARRVAEALALDVRGGRGLCPFCQGGRSHERTFSLPPGGGFRCHRAGCGAKGDALELVRQVLGLDFAGAVVWLAEREGIDASAWEGTGHAPRAARAPLAPLPPPGPPPPATWAEGAAAATWERLEGRPNAGAAHYLEGRGFPSDLAARVGSGFAFLDADAADLVRSSLNPAWLDETREGRRRGFGWCARHAGAALVVPLRSAATGSVEALHVRAFEGGKRYTLGALRDDDGTPRGYGFAGDARRADALVLCEGMADTLAAETMVQGDAGAVVVGADSADALVRWAGWLAKHKPAGRVVVVRHVDANKAGQVRAKEARDVLQRAGVPCPVFRWGDFARGLHARGCALEAVGRKHEQGEGLDLADFLDGTPFDAVRDVFRRVLGLPSTSAASSPQPAPLEAPPAYDVGPSFWDDLDDPI